jgi:hypothetical protein
MDDVVSARMRLLHRPTLRILACQVAVGCVCGALVFPCPVLAAAADPLEPQRRPR